MRFPPLKSSFCLSSVSSLVKYYNTSQRLAAINLKKTQMLKFSHNYDKTGLGI